MTPEAKILRDLESGRSTPSSTAGRINMHPQAVAIILERMERENKVESRQHGPLTIYQLVPQPKP